MTTTIIIIIIIRFMITLSNFFERFYISEIHVRLRILVLSGQAGNGAKLCRMNEHNRENLNYRHIIIGCRVCNIHFRQLVSLFTLGSTTGGIMGLENIGGIESTLVNVIVFKQPRLELNLMYCSVCKFANECFSDSIFSSRRSSCFFSHFALVS